MGSKFFFIPTKAEQTLFLNLKMVLLRPGGTMLLGKPVRGCPPILCLHTEIIEMGPVTLVE